MGQPGYATFYVICSELVRVTPGAMQRRQRWAYSAPAIAMGNNDLSRTEQQAASEVTSPVWEQLTATVKRTPKTPVRPVTGYTEKQRARKVVDNVVQNKYGYRPRKSPILSRTIGAASRPTFRRWNAA
ncbi:hypothetical protein KCP69_25655 [Salmonella enterica subsp. enterica]|nr:hypothetical protein KCP69_25655 [Salmonella enterica subsp. enterica]